MNENSFVSRELRFTDERILQWMKLHLLHVYEPHGNVGKYGYLFDCTVLPERVSPVPLSIRHSGRSRARFKKWALDRWGFSEADVTCSSLRFQEGEYLLEFTTLGNLLAPWFTLLSQALEKDIPGARFTVESHANDGFGKGSLCVFQGGLQTEFEAWEKEFESFNMGIVLPGSLEIPFDSQGIKLVHRIGGSSRNQESVDRWNICRASCVTGGPCKENLGFPTCRGALALFLSQHYPAGAENLLLNGWPILSLSGEIDAESLHAALGLEKFAGMIENEEGAPHDR